MLIFRVWLDFVHNWRYFNSSLQNLLWAIFYRKPSYWFTVGIFGIYEFRFRFLQYPIEKKSFLRSNVVQNNEHYVSHAKRVLGWTEKSICAKHFMFISHIYFELYFVICMNYFVRWGSFKRLSIPMIGRKKMTRPIKSNIDHCLPLHGVGVFWRNHICQQSLYFITRQAYAFQTWFV